MDESYKQYLASYERNWNENHGELRNWILNNPDYAWEHFHPANPEFWNKRFINCETFFSNYRPIKKPFAVVAGTFGLPESLQHFLKVLHDDTDIPQIEAALDYVEPFEWNNRHLFGNSLWELTSYEMTLNAEELKLVFLEEVDSERRKFERLRAKFSGVASKKQPSKRERITEDVKIYVWRRDEGKCVRCGSSGRLEYDHIIPVDKGGSSTERNIQLLCETCNRAKGANI